MRRGLYIAEDGRNVQDEPNKFSSDIPHLLVNLKKTPPHMDDPILKTGSPFTANNKETIFEIEHGLPYTPELFLYLYAEAYNGSTVDPKAGLYGNDRLILSGSSGTVSDIIYAEVDSKYFRIVHELEFFFVVSYTSDADKYKLRAKYYILSNDSHILSYNTKGY